MLEPVIDHPLHGGIDVRPRNLKAQRRESALARLYWHMQKLSLLKLCRLAWQTTPAAFASVARSAAFRPAPDSSAPRTALRVGFVALLVSSLIVCLLKPPTALADGLDTWTNRISGTTYELEGVTYGNGQFVVVGVAPFPGSGTILTSPDGVTWTSRNSGTPNELRAVAYGNGQFVAVGSGDFTVGGTILTSPDGVTWTRRTPPDTRSILNMLLSLHADWVLC
jgi:hypothetical protein